MENEKEKKYFIIWLYISILLHLFVVIIMLTIKPTNSPSTDPDPASESYDTQVIFMQEPSIAAQPIIDEPVFEEPKAEEVKQSEYKIATRVQGGSINISQDSTTSNAVKTAKELKEATMDKPEAALSDIYKKGMHNQTKIEDQDIDGTVNILEDATIDQQEQREKQILPPKQVQPQKIAAQNQIEQMHENNTNDFKPSMESDQKHIRSADILKAVIQDKIDKQTSSTDMVMEASADTQTKSEQDSDIKDENQEPTEELPQSLLQKVVSKKHRPADLGSENLSKIQLSKEIQETAPSKKKMSLMDIQKGFSQFIKNSSTKQIATPTSSTLGNSLYFSSTGNAQKDDELGLKLASYLNQTGKMYDSACSLYSDIIIKLLRQQGFPSENNVINIKIERSGKITEIKTIQSCGNQIIDHYHVKVIESIGNLPPVPKYIETPLYVGAQLTFKR